MKMTMRKLLAVLATLALFCSVLPLSTLFAGIADDGNLVVNGGFENGKDNWIFNSGTAEIVSDAHSGNNALSLANPNAWGEGAVQTVPVDPDSEYKITWYSKRVLGTGTFNLFVMNADGFANLQVVSGENWMNKPANSWLKHELIVNTGSAVNMMLKFSAESNNAGAILLDDVSVVKAGGGATPDVPTGEPILTEDFESGNVFGSSSSIAVEDGALKFEVTEDWGNVYTNVTTQANTDYVVSFKAKAQVPGKTLMIKFNNNWGPDVAKANVSIGTEWKEYSVTVNSAECTSLLLLFQYDGVKKDGQIYWLDDIIVAPANGDTPDVPTGDNLFVNGDFETGDATGWEIHQSTVITADAAKGGAYGAHLKGNGSWGGMLNQTATVEAGKDYTLSFWVNVNNSGVNVQVKDSAGKDIEGAGGWFDTNKKDHSVEWTFTATDDKVFLNFCGGGNGQAEDVYVDNICLVPAGEIPAPEVGKLINGDFETGDLSGWTNMWDGCELEVIEVAAHSGSYGLDFVAPKQYNHARQQVAVKPNTDYIVSAYFANAKNMQIVVKTEDDQTNIVEQGIVESETWTKNVVAFNSGNETSVHILLIGVGEGGGKAMIDDVVLAEDRPLLLNGNFENGSEGWQLNDSATVTDELVYSGKGALRLDNPTNYGEAAIQTITLEPNTDYTVKMWYKFDSGAGPFNLILMNTEDNSNLKFAEGYNNWFSKTTNEWEEKTLIFNTGDATSVLLKLTSESAATPGVLLVDNIRLYPSNEEPDEPDEPDEPELPPATLTLSNFGVLENRPIRPNCNLILNGSFENAEGGQWQEILSDNLTVVEDETAPDGSHSLFFNTSGVTDEVKSIFWMEVEPNTEYVFSTWIKGSFLSDDCRNNATIGVVDESKRFMVYEVYDDNGNLKEHFSNKTRQIVPTCWDNEWHLRSVSFNSGRATQIGIAVAGASSQVWFDDIALFKYVEGVQYKAAKQYGEIDAWDEEAKDGYCADEHNLIFDATMDAEGIAEFWGESDGWKNGFVTLSENEYEYGTSLKYTQSDNPCGTHSIKWVEVKPHTEYTFSVDMRVIKNGWGKLALIDDKKRDCGTFLRVDFDQYSWGIDWFNVTVTFETLEFDRIGICFVDAGGEALIDNMRLFESTNRIEKVKDDYVKPPYKFEWDDPATPESPDTGVSAAMASVAVALVPASAVVALKLRRKKEDEE